MDENRQNIIEAANRFYASYKDSYGFLLLVYLNKNGFIHSEYNVPVGRENVIETIDIDYLETLSISEAQRWRDAGYHTESIYFEELAEPMKNAAGILLKDLLECKEANKIEPNVLFDVQFFLSKVDFNKLKDGLFEFLIECVRRIKEGKRSDSHYVTAPGILPDEMFSLLCSLANYDGGIVFSPTPNMGAFAQKAGIPEDLFYASELNHKNWAAGKMITDMVDYHPAVFEKAYGDGEWPLIKPSLIIATPKPHGVIPIIDALRREILDGAEESLERYFLRHSIPILSKEGKIILTSTVEILSAFKDNPSSDFNPDDPDNYLINMRFGMMGKRDYLAYLDTVILLPRGLVNHPRTSQVVLMFDKAKAENAPIRMVDASDFFTATASLNILRVQELLDAINDENPSVVCQVSLEDIIECGYDINPALHLKDSMRLDMPKGCRLLKEVVDHYEGNSNDSDSTLVIVAGSKTPDGRSFPYELKEGKPVRILEKECIILNRVGNIRPVHFIPKEGVIAGYGSNSFAFIPHDDIDMNYLLSELNQPYIKQQIAAKQKGSVVPKMQLEDLLSIRISIPASLEDQRQAYREKAESRTMEFSQQFVRELESEYKTKLENLDREMHLRKHTLNQHLNSFIPGLSILPALMEKNGGILSSDMVVGKYTAETVQQRFEKLRYYAENLLKLVNTLTDDGSDYEEPNPMFSVISFVDEYCKNRLHDGYEFEFAFERYADDMFYSPDIEEDGTKHGPIQFASKGDYIDINTISMSPKWFSQALDNILTNAEKYGFTDKDRTDYKIRFSTQIIDRDGNEFLALKIANNGNPLPNGMTTDKVFQWGESSSGTGLGGWQLANIARNYGGYVKMNCYPEDREGFSVEYELGFPISNIVDI